MKAGDIVIYTGSDDPCYFHPEGELVQSVRDGFAYVRGSLVHSSELKVIGDISFFWSRARQVAAHLGRCIERTDYYSQDRREEVISSAEGVTERTLALLERLWLSNEVSSFRRFVPKR